MSQDRDPLDLAELRLLRRARRREPDALAALWRRQVDIQWSLALGVLGREADAVEAVEAVRAALARHAPGLEEGPGWRVQLLGMLWRELLHRLEPPAGDGILDPVGAPPARPDGDPLERIRRAVRSMPPGDRMIYLFHVLGRLDLDRLAEMAGLPREQVRGTCAAVTLRLLPLVDGEG